LCITGGREYFFPGCGHGGQRSRGRERGLTRTRGCVGAMMSTERIRLIVPIEIARIRAHGMIGMLRGLMVGEEALRIIVESATFRIVPDPGEKARHSFVFLIPGASEITRKPRTSSCSANLLGR